MLDWADGTTTGLALVECASEATRDKVIDRLRSILPVVEVSLPRRQSPETIVTYLDEARKRASTQILSVTGWESALPVARPLSESLGIVNFNRERILEGQPRQIWWMNPGFKNAFMHYARDTFSWFMLRLRLTELPELVTERSDRERVRSSSNVEEERARKDAEFACRQAAAAIERGDLESAIDSIISPLWSLSAMDHNADILRHVDLLDAAVVATTGFAALSDWVRDHAKEGSVERLQPYAQYLRLLGMARIESGLVEEGRPLVEEALTLTRRHVESARSAGSLRDLSVSLDYVGKVRRDAGQMAEAIAAFEESLQIRRDILRDYGSSIHSLRDLSLSLNNVGNVRRDAGQMAEAIAAFEESLQIRRDILRDYGRSIQALRDLSVSLNHVGKVRRDTGQMAEAIAAFEESLQIRRDILRDYGSSIQALRDLSLSLNHVGKVRRDTGQMAEAIAAFEESLQIARDILRGYGSSIQALRDLSVSLDNVGNVRRDAGQIAEAIAAFEESLQIRRDILRDYGRSIQALRDLAISLWSLASLEAKGGDTESLARELGELYDSLCDDYPQVESLKKERQRLAAAPWFKRLTKPS